jgi:mannose-6-phosphate isomerase-like protein (cupin superfamily)
MHINDESSSLRPGHAVYIPPRARQFIHNPGKKNLLFLCIVDPAWRKEDEEVL